MRGLRSVARSSGVLGAGIGSGDGLGEGDALRDDALQERFWAWIMRRQGGDEEDGERRYGSDLKKLREGILASGRVDAFACDGSFFFVLNDR